MNAAPLAATPSEALVALDALDTRLAARGRHTLAPGRSEARTLTELHALYGSPQASAQEREALARGLARLVQAFMDDFPENLFWDLDLLVSRLARERGAAAIEALADRVVELSHAFGGGSSIRFRYLHDFIFGFDWCRWVAKQPATRASVGPFDPEFLCYLTTRAHELADLIEADDAKYGRLRPDQDWRNPFVFSREPEDETRLLRALAARDLIPVRSWSVLDPPCWSRPFAALRESLADELGVARRSEP